MERLLPRTMGPSYYTAAVLAGAFGARSQASKQSALEMASKRAKAAAKSAPTLQTISASCQNSVMVAILKIGHC